MPLAPDGSYADILARPIQYGRLFSKTFTRGVPVAGEYVIRIKAAGMYRRNQYDPRDLRYDASEPIKLGVLLTSVDKGGLDLNNPSDVELPLIDLPDDQPTEIALRVWLEPGYTFRLTYPNGPPNLRSLLRFSVYYDRRLQPAMRQETLQFFRHLVRENLGVRVIGANVHFNKKIDKSSPLEDRR